MDPCDGRVEAVLKLNKDREKEDRELIKEGEVVDGQHSDGACGVKKLTTLVLCRRGKKVTRNPITREAGDAQGTIANTRSEVVPLSGGPFHSQLGELGKPPRRARSQEAMGFILRRGVRYGEER